MVIIGVSFAMLIITLVLLISVLYSVNQDSRIYEVLLAILTGLTASFVVSIIMETCNNYRFNSKRQRELRKYFKFISHYKMQQKIELKQSTEYEATTSLGRGAPHHIFINLKKIIPELRNSLLQRDYLYPKEINEIDNILYGYEDIIQFSKIKILPIYLELIGSKDENIEEIRKEYPKLCHFLEIELNSSTNKVNNVVQENITKELNDIIEKAIFNAPEVFADLFKITDKKAKHVENKNLEPLDSSKKCLSQDKSSDELSIIISQICAEINASITKLNKRVCKEPVFWKIAEKGMD